jgi:hypothetical protein
MHKKECLQIILQWILSTPTHNMPVGTHTLRMCANGHFAGPAQEAPRGAQAVWHLQITYIVVGLKAGEITSSRWGGTKLVNHVEVSGKETRVGVDRLSS